MKRLKQILVTLTAVAFMASCNKEEMAPENDINVEKSTISAKWIVDSSGDYKSFEFNESGNYIVTENTSTGSTNDQAVLFGTYEIVEGNSIVLSDFGTLEISEINDNSISFSVQLMSNPDSEIIINALKQEESESSTTTDLLCQTWQVVSLGGEPMSNVSILFSNAGTYLVTAEVQGEQITGSGTWIWCNADENKLAFAVENELDCDGLDIIKDIKLTSDSFIGIDMESGEPEEIIMKAASSTTAGRSEGQQIEIKNLGFGE